MGCIKWVLQHGINRFLPLLPATDGIFQVSEGLKSYFNSEEQCPLLIKIFFENPCGQQYLLFVCGQLNLFNRTILQIEITLVQQR
jgi:hypothetical protein